MNKSSQLSNLLSNLLSEDNNSKHTVTSSDSDHAIMLAHLKKHAVASNGPTKELTYYKLTDNTGVHNYTHSTYKGERSGITSTYSNLHHLRQKATA